ncbi:unnamed protein product [Cylicocyclus nassatus]|uniref:Uncharacterized protein n=1 Tax=Cylicocyclus nassatus TaxID=53992 RepID=A0AA36GK89_CYLNA|nr:unnamed protein product [Cylicocyclus nassatus]
MEASKEAQVSEEHMDTENVRFYDSMERRIERLRKDLERVPGDISSEMTEHKISARYKEKYEMFIREKVRELSGELNEMAEQCRSIEDERDSTSEAMKTLGIQSVEDWREFVRVAERNREILTQACNMLITNVLQVPTAIQDLKKKGGETEKVKQAPAVQSKADWSAVRTKLEQLCVGITQFAFRGQGRGTKRSAK